MQGQFENFCGAPSRLPERKRDLCMQWTGMAMERSDFPQKRRIV
jgi:hypothetical protein